MQSLFNSGRAAIVANTGTLVAPATKTQINSNTVPLPDSLFSHFDQTAAWQAIASNLGSSERVGWGGAVADAIEAMNMNSNSMFTCISTAGNALFLAGQSSFQLNVTPAGPIPIYGLQNPPFGLPSAANPLNSISRATRRISSPRSMRSSSTAPCRPRPRWLLPWLLQAWAASLIRRSISIP
ncbi:MAG: hypothetical protein WDM87_13315 [Terracidiphilus sp.]